MKHDTSANCGRHNMYAGTMDSRYHPQKGVALETTTVAARWRQAGSRNRAWRDDTPTFIMGAAMNIERLTVWSQCSNTAIGKFLRSVFHQVYHLL